MKKNILFLIAAVMLCGAVMPVMAQKKKVAPAKRSNTTVINFTAVGELGIFALRGPVKECVWTTKDGTQKLGFDRQGMWVSKDGNKPWDNYGSVKRDSKGRIIQMGDGEESGELFTYNSNGLMTKHVTVYMDGRDIATYTYNNKGECTKESFGYGDMYGSGKNVAVFTILSRDEQGNWTKRKTQNGNVETRTITYYEDMTPVAVSTAPSLRSRLDSASYCIGMAQSQGLTAYLKDQLGVDLGSLDHFTRGLTSQPNTAASEKQRKAYSIGTEVGGQVKNQMLPGINKELFGEGSTKTISLELFLSGFISGYTGKGGLMTADKAKSLVESLMKAIKVEEALKVYGSNKTAGERFLAANAQKADVKILPCGVQYRIVKQGSGAIPTQSQKVKVHFKGRTIDGKELDDTYKTNKPAEFVCNQVIKGWTEALTHMPVGSVWEVFIPQELAYEEREQGVIQPFSALIFTIELLDIVK